MMDIRRPGATIGDRRPFSDPYGSSRRLRHAARACAARRSHDGRRGRRPGTRAVRLMVGRSAVVDVGAAITRVSLTSPDVADALVTSPNELLLNGKAPGTISMFVWDRAGGSATTKSPSSATSRG